MRREFPRSRAPRAIALSFAVALVAATVSVLGLGWWDRAGISAAPTANRGLQLASAVASPPPQAPKEPLAPKPKRTTSQPPQQTTRGVLPLVGVALLFLVKSLCLAPDGSAPKPAAKAPRITAFDSMRFFLIMYIVCGHFVSFASPSKFAFQAITQINVVVGAFFSLSGYVSAYTTTEIGEKKVKDKIGSTPAPKFILQRVFGFWPLHIVVLLLFSPMFIYADNKYNGPLITAAHGLMAVTMTQAWFPMHAEVWNAPTWFLGALTFATILQPYFTPFLARQGKKELRRTAMWLTLIGLLPKIAYCYDCNAWGLLEGAQAPKYFANLAVFNSLRFGPFHAVIEVMLGFVACRLVMLDGVSGEGPAIKPGLSDTVLPLAGMVGIILLRAADVVAVSDMIIRPCVFMPLFLLFLMGLHRATIQTTVTDPVAKFMAVKPLVFLGGLSFPIFVVHGPLGQLFYKKAIASKVFGGTMNAMYGAWFFYVYLIIVTVAAFFLNKFFMSSKRVAEWSASMQSKLVKYL